MVILKIEDYKLALDLVKEASINTLFARSVAEKKVSGKIFVDQAEKPSTFYIIHPYGMSLLIGNSQNEKFNLQLLDYAQNRSGKRNQIEWMQAFPESWDYKLKDLFGDKLIPYQDKMSHEAQDFIELNTRVNFRFNQEKYLDFKAAHIKESYEFVAVDESIFHAMKGTVVPANFWDSAEDFLKMGVGFSLFDKGKLAATSYSAFIFDKQIELGMETLPEFRGRGFGQQVCTALIDYCIINDYEPIWACNLANVPSYNLALKLGFEPSLLLPYYRLNK